MITKSHIFILFKKTVTNLVKCYEIEILTMPISGRTGWWVNIVEQYLSPTPSTYTRYPPSRPSVGNSLWDNISLLVIISSECLEGKSRREKRAICNNWTRRVIQAYWSQSELGIKDWENKSAQQVATCIHWTGPLGTKAAVACHNSVSVSVSVYQPSCQPFVPLIAMHKFIGKWLVYLGAVHILRNQWWGEGGVFPITIHYNIT